jgi:cell division protease FtsH
VFGEVTTGAESALTEATRLARRMVTRWGIGDLGLVAFRADDEHPFLGYELAQGHDYSEATGALIDQKVQCLFAERHAYAGRMLTDVRELLDYLAQALLQAETLDQNALARILGPRPRKAEEKPD